MSARPPRTLEQAAALAGRYAELNAAIDVVEAKRKQRLAKVGAIADAKVAPLLAERGQIFGQLKGWYEALPAGALKGKKSIELAGGTIGTREGNAALTVPEDEKGVIASLLRRVWGKPLLREKHELDKTKIKAALDGPYKAALKKLGFGIRKPVVFFIDMSAATIGAGDRESRAA